MKLFEAADRYLKESDWKTMAMLKFCLFSMGIIVGVLLPDGARTPVLILFGLLFAGTCIPLMAKLFRIWKQ